MPTTQAFGDVVVGMAGMPQTFTVRNTGRGASGMPMVSTSSPEFQLGMNNCSMPIAPGGMCTFQVTLRPTSAGAKGGNATVSAMPGGSVSASLSGNGVTAPQLRAEPNPVAFGDAAVMTTVMRAVTITNTGGQPVTLGAPVLNSMDFSIPMMGGNGCTAALAPNATCTINVAFRPTSAGDKSAMMTVSGPMGQPSVNVGLNGRGTAPALAINPPMQAFAAAVGAMEERTLTVTNTGNAPSGPVTLAISGAAMGDYSVDPSSCGALQPSGNCTVRVTFKPTAMGARAATLTASAMPGGMATAMLAGNAAMMPPRPVELTISPATAPFGTVGVGSSSSEQTFTVRNVGGTASQMLTVMIEGAGSAHFALGTNMCNAALMPNATCTITVRFAPTSVGDKAASLVVRSGTVTAMAALSGAGIMGPSVTVTPSPSTFSAPGVVVGQQSADRVLTVTNTGMMATGMLTVMLSGADANQFVLVNNGCVMLAPGESCLVTIAFKPTSAGIKNGSLAVGAATGQLGAATLQGTGLNPIDISPTTIDAGQASAGTNGMSVTYKVTLRVPGTPTAAITAGIGEFAAGAVGPCVNAGTPAGANINPANVVATDSSTFVVCDTQVQFTPKDPEGPKMGTLTVTSGGASATAAVTGTAVGPLVITPDAPASSGAFGNVSVNTLSGAVTFRATNNGTVDLTNVVATVTGGEFNVTSNTCTSGGTLAASNVGMTDECTVTVVFAPTTAGDKAATITVTGTLMGTTTTKTATYALTGTGVTGQTISVTPETAAFGPTPLTGTSAAQTFTVTNPAMAPTATGMIMVEMPTNPDFKIANNLCIGGSATLNPGASCTFQVVFEPGIVGGAGTRTASVTVTAGVGGSDRIDLTGTAVQPISIAPPSRDFGLVATMDAASPLLDFVITNASTVATPALTPSIVAGTGPGNFTVAAFETTPGVACPGGVIPAGGTCTVRVRLVPAARGATTATLRVQDVSGNIVATASLSGTGGTPADLEFVNIPDVTPDPTRSFGTVTQGQTPSYSFILTNVGELPTGAINRVLTVTSGLATDFVVGGDCNEGGTLGPAGTCTVTVGIAAGATTGAKAATFVVQAAAGQAGGTTETIEFSATVQSAASLTITPPVADLGASFASTPGMTAVFTVKNDTGAVLAAFGPSAVTAPFIIPAMGDNCNGVALAPGISCTVTVQFSPGAIAEGFHTGTLTVGTAVAALLGRVRKEADVTMITGAPAAGTIAFGSVLLNGSSDITLVVKNTGERATGALSVVKAGANANQFSIVTDGCNGQAVPENMTCNIVARFAPNDAALVGMPLTATISVAGMPGGMETFMLSGTPVQPALLSALGPGNVTTLAFNNRELGLDTAAIVVTISNRANSQATSAVSIELSDKVNYKFGMNGCTTAQVSGLASGGTCTIEVIFDPQAIGALNGMLTVAAGTGGTQVLTLTGTGDPSFTVDKATETFSMGVGNDEKIFTYTATPPIAGPPMIVANATGTLTTVLGGTDAAAFQITGNTCVSKSLHDKAMAMDDKSCTVKVKFLTPGMAKTATLTVGGSPAGNQRVSILTGS